MSDFAGTVGMPVFSFGLLLVFSFGLLLVFSFWVLLMVKGCAHRHTTTPRKDEEGAYVRCLECGARIAEPLWDM